LEVIARVVDVGLCGLSVYEVTSS